MSIDINATKLSVLKNTFIMYYETYQEVYEKCKENYDNLPEKPKHPETGQVLPFPDAQSLARLESIQYLMDEAKESYLAQGGSEEGLMSFLTDEKYQQEKENTRRSVLEKLGVPPVAPKKAIKEPIDEKMPNTPSKPKKPKKEPKKPEKKPIVDEAKKFYSNDYKKTDEGVLFDMIPLPSKGECYKHKLSSLPVSYLTAFDENLIASPNLYSDGTFIDTLLKQKIMNENIDPADLLPGDRDAIILWLRGTGYGTNFPVTATDSETGTQFNAEVDLNQIETKELTLEGDENGYFDFTLPVSGDKIKFKFLSYREQKELASLNESSDISILRKSLVTHIEKIRGLVTEDGYSSTVNKTSANSALDALEEYADNLDADEGLPFSLMITNKMIMSIVSVNGITKRDYISNYVMKMKVKDSLALRKYITDNEPGLDYNITVERPESLGGGSINLFLQLDEYLFLSV